MRRVLMVGWMASAIAACSSSGPSFSGYDPNGAGGSGASSGASGANGGGSSGLTGASDAGNGASGVTGYSGSTGAGASGSGGAGCGLPADIESVLTSSCMSCHGSPPIGGAPMSLVTYANLTAPARTAPTKSVGELCVERMSSTNAPMPPAGIPGPSAAEIATFGAWVSAGMPQAPCAGSGGGSGSAGATGATGSSGASGSTGMTGATGFTGSSGATGFTGSSGATGSTGGSGASGASGSAGGASGAGMSGTSGTSGSSGYNTPVKCSSGKMWTGGTGATMRPGDACTTCHSNFFGGTVFPTAHEPTDCDGANATSATVVITDASGKVITLPVNAVGNFYTTRTIATPFHAKVLNGSAERSMVASQTSGNCNSCHTEQGSNGAPGRIMLP